MDVPTRNYLQQRLILICRHPNFPRENVCDPGRFMWGREYMGSAMRGGRLYTRLQSYGLGPGQSTGGVERFAERADHKSPWAHRDDVRAQHRPPTHSQTCPS